MLCFQIHANLSKNPIWPPVARNLGLAVKGLRERTLTPPTSLFFFSLKCKKDDDVPDGYGIFRDISLGPFPILALCCAIQGGLFTPAYPTRAKDPL